MGETGDKPKKVHKKAASGAKAKKKKEKDGPVERHNPKAHTFSGGAKSVAKRVQFSLEKQSKKEHAPKVDKTPDVPPPFVVAVQGPPGVGKTTLVHSLVKHWARQKLLQMNGPVTLVSGRHRRITIVEVPQDMPTMLDIAKVADLVLVMIDGSYGFELETFEFINILQVHGFPRVIGILTHLDGYKDNKQLRKVKKTMKQRFWSEVFDGAKMFYLSGLQYGRYHRLEIQNLARFIAVTRGPILSYRQSHPYLLGLRWEDHTDPTLPEHAPRRLDVYGYVYGGRLREGSQAHLAGVGDFHIAQVKRLADPCPPPVDVESERNKGKKDEGKTKVKNALRTLAERHRVIYAPGSDVGSITVDSEAMYINVAEHQVGFTKKDDEEDGELPEAVKMVRDLQSGKASLDWAGGAGSSLRLTKGASVRLAEGTAMEHLASESGRQRRPAVEGEVAADREDEEADDESGEEEDLEVDDEEDGAVTGEEDAATQVKRRASERFAKRANLEKAIYGGSATREDEEDHPVNASGPKATDHKTVPLFDSDGEDEDAEVQGTAAKSSRASRGKAKADLLGNLGDLGAMDSARMPTLPGQSADWDEERKGSLRSRKFITGGWSSAEEDEDGEPKQRKEKKEGEEGQDGEAPAADGAAAAAAESTTLGTDEMQRGVLKVREIKSDDYDSFQDGMPIATFVRVRLEDVPAASVAELRRDRLLLLGGLLPGEAQMGMVQVRVKRHRWHPKLLKSNDALLVSSGWRRFQTVPTFCLEDRGEKRMRFLKYTLEHAHCTMTMYGPMAPPNSGVMAFRSWKKVDHFRIAATGGVLESAPDFNVVKKLKLVGEPYKIFRNTAFIKGMFNSDLEVAKYAHSKIQTVSGIRGEIKKAEGTKGCFRATFEDRILMSDLVVCKCWVKVQPKQFYNPVMDVESWRPARLIGELRAATGTPVPNNHDSRYGKQVVRAERKFNPLKIPKALQGALPFKTKPKLDPKKKKNKLRQKAAVVVDGREKEINHLMHRLGVVRKEKQRIRKAASAKKKDVKAKREKFIQDKRDVVQKEIRKKRYVKAGMEETKRRKTMNLD